MHDEERVAILVRSTFPFHQSLCHNQSSQSINENSLVVETLKPNNLKLTSLHNGTTGWYNTEQAFTTIT